LPVDDARRSLRAPWRYRRDCRACAPPPGGAIQIEQLALPREVAGARFRPRRPGRAPGALLERQSHAPLVLPLDPREDTIDAAPMARHLAQRTLVRGEQREELHRQDGPRSRNCSTTASCASARAATQSMSSRPRASALRHTPSRARD
jgi:hypothetical protein